LISEAWLRAQLLHLLELRFEDAFQFEQRAAQLADLVIAGRHRHIKTTLLHRRRGPTVFGNSRIWHVGTSK
jgi:hypothetical protein